MRHCNHDNGICLQDANDDTISCNTFGSDPYVLYQDNQNISEILEQIREEGTVHSDEQHINVHLMHMLGRAGAPDHLCTVVISWAKKANQMKYSFSTHHLPTQKSATKDLMDHYGMHCFCPSVEQIELESISELVPVVCFNFISQLFSLLNDTNLMQPNNLLINLPTDGGTNALFLSIVAASIDSDLETFSHNCMDDSIVAFAPQPAVLPII